MSVWGRTFSFLVLGALVTSCLPGVEPKKSTTSAISYCEIAENQLGSLAGRWRSLPIPVAFRADQFTREEMQQIVFAVNVWNRFFLKVHKVNLFDIGTDDSPRLSTLNRSASLCSKSIVDGTGSYTGEVVIYKNTKWPYTNARSAIAFTEYCRRSANPILEMHVANIDINYEDFFVEGKPQPDLVTNIVHELGHVAGLDHSCNSKSESDARFVGCGSNPAQEYMDAVMYPFDASSAGQTRRVLQKNDQARSNCLYGGDAYPWN